MAAHGKADAGARTATRTDATGGRGDGAGASGAGCGSGGSGDVACSAMVRCCREEVDGGLGLGHRVLLHPLVVEDATDPRRERRVRRRGVHGGGEVGARVGAP